MVVRAGRVAAQARMPRGHAGNLNAADRSSRRMHRSS
jgi:hypothetical protein